MKVLLLVLLVIGLIIWWRAASQRRRNDSATGPDHRPEPPAQAQHMIACGHCGVHLPRSEAVEGARGVYCSVHHRQAAEPESGP